MSAINDLSTLPPHVKAVYEEFVYYYKEPSVDIQFDSPYYRIIVHWDTVTVRNEYDHHVTIWDLYGSVQIDKDGYLSFDNIQFKRSTFTKEQWASNYMHSHVNWVHPKKEWQYCCLGKGPLVTRTEFLHHNYDIDIWKLFVWELDKYVHVESITGVPYRRMDDISGYSDKLENFGLYTSNMCCSYSTRSKLIEIANILTRELISKQVLKFAYHDDEYTLGMSYKEAVIAINNTFFNWYNSSIDFNKKYPVSILKSYDFLQKKVITPFGIASKGMTEADSSFENTMEEAPVLLTFKGMDVRFQPKVVETSLDSDPEVYVLSPSIIEYVLYKILNFININYDQTIFNPASAGVPETYKRKFSL